ncbi:hypothetical protein IH575_00830 [Candidatus Dojkabacteria bacterium]|nr:hypothetical protein [Candidatus Dojkabacteria bacterium]
MNFFDSLFLQGFLGNLFATLIGVIVGIPVALWINRSAETTTENKKKKQILELLSPEIENNRTTISKWKNQGENDWTLTTIGLKLRDEVWNAFSDGGELAWIKDSALLANLAEVYGKIIRIKYLSDKYVDFNSRDTATNQIIKGELLYTLQEVQGDIDSVTRLIDGFLRSK